ncbi:MAG: type II toxin-antitoxin system Phd/YefM family antitoxin [Pyrinomonadaceae bacterium]
MHQVNVEEAKTELLNLIDAAVSGEEIFITKNDRPVVKIVPVLQTNSHPQFGSAKGLVIMSDDFNEPLGDFDEYTK